jgi:hypothetical protein
MNDWQEQLLEVKKKLFPDLKDKMVRFSNKQVKAKKYVKLHDTSKSPRLSGRKYTK